MLSIEPLTPVIGAIVNEVDLSALDESQVKQLEEAWAKYLVLFLHEQKLNQEQLRSVGRYFGELHIHPQGDVPGYPGLIPIHTDESSSHYAGRTWHSDVSCDEQPPAASILYLHEVPETGGDTLFANMYSAFEALSPPIQLFLLKLTALHSGRQDYEGYYGMSADEMRDGRFPEAEHPVVRTHPVTGRKALYVNEIFTQHIVGLQPSESRALLDFLFRHIAEPRFQCRFRWRPNSVAMWDNRCAQHMALWDYHPHSRSGYRATIAGDRPC